MTLPVPQVHLAQVDYACTFAALTAGPVTFAVPDPVHFTFNFETGQDLVSPGVYQVTTDYSWFSQGQVEDDITIAMEAICTAIATMTGLPVADVRAASSVRRVWLWRPDLIGGGWSSAATSSTDLYHWVPPSDADSAAGTDSGQAVGDMAGASTDSAAGDDSVFSVG